MAPCLINTNPISDIQSMVCTTTPPPSQEATLQIYAYGQTVCLQIPSSIAITKPALASVLVCCSCGSVPNDAKDVKCFVSIDNCSWHYRATLLTHSWKACEIVNRNVRSQHGLSSYIYLPSWISRQGNVTSTFYSPWGAGQHLKEVQDRGHPWAEWSKLQLYSSSKNQFNITVSHWKTYQILSW